MAKKNTPEKAKKTNEQKEGRNLLFRCIAIGLGFALVGGGLSYRLSVLQMDEASEWQARAINQQLANIPIEPARGVIYDSNMKAMAVSATVWTIDAAPNVMVNSNLANTEEKDPARIAARELARILELDEEELYGNLSEKESKYYQIKAKVEKPLADEVRNMYETYGISGIYLKQDSKRFYPYDDLGATVLGFTNADGDGIEGIESWYNEELAGTPGRQVTVQNAWGGEIATGEAGETFPVDDGRSIVLTINTDIQQVTEKYLATAVGQYAVKQRGMAIVMDVNTGEILALAVSPAYNPNDPYGIFSEAPRDVINGIEDPEARSIAQGEARTLQWRNKALADTYEPGSVLKVITAAAALDSGAYNTESTFFCSSTIEVSDRTFGCAQSKAHGVETVSKALIDSCNVSFVQMSAGMGVDVWYDYINAFGLTEPTGVDLPGEPGPRAISNLVYAKDAMGPVELASCSFGQSNKYTALQMITAVSAAVNGGNLMQPHIVKQILDADGNVIENIEPVVKRQVISPETSIILNEAMETMVSETSSGRNAYVAGYHVGGKSGTSQKLELLTQENREEYISSFLGFAPANNPRIAVLVVLDEPEDPEYGTYFGGRLAGPPAGNIIKESLEILGVEPEYDNAGDMARTTVSTPKLIDVPVTNALVTLNQGGLQGVVVGGGEVIVGQSPDPYTQIPNGGQVIIYTEPGFALEMTIVPDFVGKTGQGAIDEAKALGLNVMTTGAPAGGSNVHVTAQDVAVGTEVVKGATVTFTLTDTTVVADN